MAWIRFIGVFIVSLVGTVGLIQLMPNDFVTAFIIAMIMAVISVREHYGD